MEGYQQHDLFRYRLPRFTQRWRLAKIPTTPLPPSHTLPSLRLRAGSEEPLCRASHNRGRSGSRVPVCLLQPLPPPSPWRSINISQIRLQKNTVFIRRLCKLRRRVSPFVSRGQVFSCFAYFFFFLCMCIQLRRVSELSHKQNCVLEVTNIQADHHFTFVSLLLRQTMHANIANR